MPAVWSRLETPSLLHFVPRLAEPRPWPGTKRRFGRQLRQWPCSVRRPARPPGGTSVNNGRAGYFSDIYYDRNRNEWWGLSDRAPAVARWTTRRAHSASRSTWTRAPARSATSRSCRRWCLGSNGNALNGIAPSPSNTLGLAHDSEGIVVLPKTGNLLVSDEYGPSVREFTRAAASWCAPTSRRPT